MDRGWHHSSCSGPDRPRLGHRPYVRGRGLSNDRRGCYHCGQDGHVKKFCPQLDGRYGDSGILMEWSAGGVGSGRRCNDSWPSSRNVSSVGKEHGYSRNESLREGSSSRRSHFDYHESGGSSQRPRDNADRYRDNEGRGHGVVADSSANLRERDPKSSRGSARKPSVDEHHPGAGGHREEEWKENRSKECESNSEKLAANGNALVQYPPSRLHAAEGTLRVKDADDRLMSNVSDSDVKLGTNGNIADVEGNSTVPSLDEHAAQQIAVSQHEPEGPVPKRGSCEPSNKGGERELGCRVDQASRSSVSNKRLSNAKLPLSILCEDAAEGNLERKYKNEPSVFSPLLHLESVSVVEPVLPVSSDKHPGMQDRNDGSVLGPVLESAKLVEQGPLNRKLGIAHSVLSYVVENAAHVELSSGETMNVQESCTEGQLDFKVGCLSPPQTEEGMVKSEDCKISNFTDGEPPDRGCIKDKGGREGKALSEYSGQPDVHGLSGCHGQSGMGRRLSRCGTRREEHQSGGSGSQDVHVVVQVSESISAAAKDLERALPSGMNAADQVFEGKGHHGHAKGTSHLEGDGLSHKSENGTRGLVRNLLSKEKDNETASHLRGLEPDCCLKNENSEFQEGELGLDYGSADEVREKDSLWQRSKNVISCTLTTVKLRNNSKDGDISHDSYTGLSSREGSVDRTSERNGFYRYGASTGLKDVYRRHDYVGDYDRAGSRDRLGNSSELCVGDDPTEHFRCLDWRHSRNWEAHPGHSQYLPGSYVNVCNARYLQSRMFSPFAISPPSSQAFGPLDPFFSSTRSEEVQDNPVKSQRKGWMFLDGHGNLEGPVALGELKELAGSGKLPSDYMVQYEGSNEWVTLEHAQTPVNSNFPVSSIGLEQLPAAVPARVSHLIPQVCAPIVQESYQAGAYNVENSDQDICPPGTETCAVGYGDKYYENFHIDERIEKLMDGVNLIPGNEKQIVHDVLCKASRRVQQDYESDIAIGESPRSDGGFADMGDQSKDGDFGSDVQRLEGLCSDQQVTKVDVKAEDAVMEVQSDGGKEVVKAPNPTPAVSCHAESNQEPWQWTVRGGDWKLVYVVDNVQQRRGEVQKLSEKGHAGYPRKVVMNGGFPLCESKTLNLRDPRKQNLGSAKVHLSESRRLLFPKFSQKAMDSKLGTSAGDRHTTYSQLSTATPKGPSAIYPKFQGSTPCTLLSMPAKDHSSSMVPVGGSKMSKAGKSITNQGSVPGSGSKSPGLSKLELPLTRGLKSSNLAIKRMLPATVKGVGMVESRDPRQVVGFVDNYSKPASDPAVDSTCSKRRRSLPDGSLGIGSPPDRQQVPHMELSKSEEFVNRFLSSEEALALEEGQWYYLDGAGHEEGPFCLLQLQSLVASGKILAGSSVYRKKDDTWVPLRKLPGSGVPLGELVSSSGNLFSPHISKDAGTESCLLPEVTSCRDNHQQFFGFARGMRHEFTSYRPVLSAVLNEGLDKWIKTTEQEKPCPSFDDAGRMVEVVLQDTLSMYGGLYQHKRKTCSLEDGEPCKQHRNGLHRACILDIDGDGDGDRKSARKSHVTHVLNSTMPPLIDDNPSKVSEVGAVQTVKHLDYRVQEQSWATLRPGLLRLVFHSIRGDVKTLVNAMATCKSWSAIGKRCKTELKRADLSSVQDHSLDAVLESLPGFGGGKLQRIILKGCTVSPESLGHLLRACPSISVVEMGCNEPLKELIRSFPKVRWLGGHTGLQSPMECLTFRREDLHLKPRSLKLIAKGRDIHRDFMSRDGDESEMHSASDSGSKVKTEDGYSCLISADVEASINESVHDSEITHLTHRSRNVVKYMKLNNGGRLVKKKGLDGSTKAVEQENRVSGSPLHLRRKALAAPSPRKYEKVSKRVFGGHRTLADKHSGPSGKLEQHSKSAGLSLFEGDKSLEKEMATVLRVMMDADTDKCFQLANIISTDGKGGTRALGKTVDLLMIEKKLKGGTYGGGKDGFKAFKEDVNLLIRTAFRNDKDKSTYSTAEKIFKLALQHFASLDSQIAGALPADSHTQNKLPGARSFSKAGKGRVNDLLMLQHRPGKKRKAWNDDGVQKGKFGVNKKGRQGESSSGDVDSDVTEHETRMFAKPKERRWESEGDSSEEDEDSGFMEEDEEEEETEASDSDVPSESEGEDVVFEDDNYDTEDERLGYHDWGARMTKAAMVPPVTRKYAVIEEYRIVADKERVKQKMKVELPRDYEEKMQAVKEKRSDNYTHLDIPEMKDYKPRKKLGEEVCEQEVYGIDPYTHNLLLDTMPADILGFSESQKQQFIEERLLFALNKEARQYSCGGKAPMEYSLEKVVERISTAADIGKEWALHEFSEQLLDNIRNRQKDKFVAYRKGLGVVCNKYDGLDKDEFVVEFFGEVYPPWRWYEKQDGIRSLQKKEMDTTPEFYNIFYERPKGDAAGYDLLVVDAMHKANFASRLCHSCRPNCEAKITAVNNTYMIGVYTLKPIKYGEELTFDYNSVTESKEEYDNAICLCGSQGCRGSYLNLTGSGTFEEVILKDHGLLDRHYMLLDSCISVALKDEEWREMRQAGLGTCLLSGLPTWVLKYVAHLVHFMNYEKTHLPGELLKDLELKRKQGVIEGCTELDAEIITEGVYNQRLQNLAITLDKVQHILTELYKNPSLAPPPLRKLDPKDMVQWIWKGDDSVVNELLQCMTPHLPEDTVLELKLGISKNVPQDGGFDLKERLLWYVCIKRLSANSQGKLRDELRRLPATCKARHDAAADLIHVYAYTKCFFTMEDYAVVESSAITILPLDLGSSRHSLSGPKSWHKTYSREYIWGQLINWYKQNGGDPGASLAKAARGCLRLPDLSSCYAKNLQRDFKQGYGQKHREKMICHMVEKPQQKWPKSKFWSQLWGFRNERVLFGSPMLDSVIEDRPLDDHMVKWLKFRKDVFVGPWDER